jgi:hypothetical protein
LKSNPYIRSITIKSNDMAIRTVLYDDELFECVSFYDVDSGIDGINVYYLNNKSYIGEIEDIIIPDDGDDDEIRAFEKKVKEWLHIQDVNYLLG